MSLRPPCLPPLASLRGFEASARLGSFSRAADELNMTQSAVSHQIKTLEAFLGQPLFLRVNRSVELTDAGADFAETVRRALALLSDGVNRLEFYRKPGSVIISAPAGFAAKWLVPRLARLRAQHPEVEPWIFAATEIADLNRSEVDFAIAYGDGVWPDCVSELLFRDAVTPLVSPMALPEQGLELAELRGLPLIHDERREDWSLWLAGAGLEGADTVAGLNFGDFGLSLDAAAAGQGVVLGSLALAAAMLETGALIRPFELALPTADNPHLIYLPKRLRRPAERKFYDWLKAEAAAMP